MQANILFHNYFKKWVKVYKVGAISDRTLEKYWLSYRHLKAIAPDLKLSQINRMKYQLILNDYAENHERSTTMDFHHQLKSSLQDAYEDGLIKQDPTRKVIVKGRQPAPKKKKYLSEYELKQLLNRLDLSTFPSIDWIILLVAKTGLRFGEALGLTKESFDFNNQQLIIEKTWDYKNPNGGWRPTKNESSVRKVPIDWKLAMQFNQIISEIPESEPIFVKQRIFNSTVNSRLKSLCEQSGVPVISMHGLRHTHASLLLFAGVSIASVSKRLGHADMTTTQQTYLHIIQELENKDNSIIMQHLASL